MFGLFLVIFLILVAIFGPLLVQSPTKYSKTVFREPPTRQHPFGVDHRGADVFARVVYGIRLSIFIGFMATAIETFIGVVVGAPSPAGTAGGSTRSPCASSTSCWASRTSSWRTPSSPSSGVA
ncbi:MAG: hypothetical protein V9G12_13890 [Microthrixaceae bacterium]